MDNTSSGEVEATADGQSVSGAKAHQGDKDHPLFTHKGDRRTILQKIRDGIVPRPVADAFMFDANGDLCPMDVSVKLPPKSRSLGTFARISTAQLEAMALNPPPPTAARLFNYLLSRPTYELSVDIQQKALAAALSVPQPHISRSLKWLVEKHYLLPASRDGTEWKPGRCRLYCLNPFMVGKGHDRYNVELQEEYRAFAPAGKTRARSHPKPSKKRKQKEEAR
jgi:hypothetical protein